jgi:hypothetical protein
MTAPLRILYIAGTGRSGSTLVAQSLERRTNGVHAGEVRYLWDRGVAENHLCECGSPFDRCEFWTEVVSAAYGGELTRLSTEVRSLSHEVDRIRRIPQALTKIGSAYRERIRVFGELIKPLYDAIAVVAGTDLVIDSSKDPSYLYLLSALDELDVEPVHLVRDPRAVAYSWTRTRRRPEIHWKAQYMRTLRPRRTALIWLEYNTVIDVFMTRHRSTSRLRYEDFSLDPEATIRDVCRSAGVPLSERPKADAAGHSISGNPMRFERGPRVVRLDNEWEAGLPAHAQRVVTALTLPLLHRYDYRTRVSRSSQCA